MINERMLQAAEKVINILHYSSPTLVKDGRKNYKKVSAKNLKTFLSNRDLIARN